MDINEFAKVARAIDAGEIPGNTTWRFPVSEACSVVARDGTCEDCTRGWCTCTCHSAGTARTETPEMTTAAQMTAPEFVTSVAALCKPGEAALVMVYANDGLSFCIAADQTSREIAGHIEADDEDTLLGVAVITADGTLVEYPVRNPPVALQAEWKRCPACGCHANIVAGIGLCPTCDGE